MPWDESKHPRVPAGSSEGGQFTDKIVAAARTGAGLPPEKYNLGDINRKSMRTWGLDEQGNVHTQESDDLRVMSHSGLAEQAGLWGEDAFVVRGWTAYFEDERLTMKMIVYYANIYDDSELEFWDNISRIYDDLRLPGNTAIYKSLDTGYHGQLIRRHP